MSLVDRQLVGDAKMGLCRVMPLWLSVLLVLSALAFCGCAPGASPSYKGLQPHCPQVAAVPQISTPPSKLPVIRHSSVGFASKLEKQMRELSLRMGADRKMAKDFQDEAKRIASYQPNKTETEPDYLMLGEQQP